MAEVTPPTKDAHIAEIDYDLLVAHAHSEWFGTKHQMSQNGKKPQMWMQYIFKNNLDQLSLL